MKKNPFGSMVRRRWLGAGALSALAWPQAPAQPAKAPQTHLRLAAAWPDKMPGLSDAVRRWALRVNTLSGGQLHIDVRF
jgi:TRAP-type mannitol/chloroaromatic compound transport system substrate-binding protein